MRERLGRRDSGGCWLGGAQARDEFFGLLADMGKVLGGY